MLPASLRCYAQTYPQTGRRSWLSRLVKKPVVSNWHELTAIAVCDCVDIFTLREGHAG